MRFWRIAIALAACFGVGLQFFLMVSGRPAAEAASKIVEFFSYFTIVSNILASVALTAPLVAPASRLGAWAEQAGPRAAVATYLTITALVYHAILASQWRPEGLHLLADTLLHTATPIAFLVDLAVRGGAGEARWIAALKALVLPAAYGAWTLVHGALSGFYPYPFMNVTKRGYPAVVLTMLEMTVAFAVVSLAFVALSRVRSRVASPRTQPISA